MGLYATKVVLHVVNQAAIDNIKNHRGNHDFSIHVQMPARARTSTSD